MLRISRVVEDRNAERFAFHRTGIVDPGGRFTPDFFFSLRAKQAKVAELYESYKASLQ